MRTFKTQHTAMKWARLALKGGLLLTDTKLWAAVSERLRERVDDVGDDLREQYEEKAERLHEARQALQGRQHWVAPTINFLGGIGLGIGLGLLFAPVSGEEARTALRDKVVDMKNRVAGGTGFGSSTANAPSTGTNGD
jgi:gas vesicle protein